MPMKKLPLLAGLLAALAGAGAFASEDLDAAIRAKIAKEKSKKTAEQRQREHEGAADRNSAGSECGRVDIGNFYAGSRPRARVAPEITVVITGDVINANNHCD